MWYNYCGEPAGETEKEAREFAKNRLENPDYFLIREIPN